MQSSNTVHIAIVGLAATNHNKTNDQTKEFILNKRPVRSNTIANIVPLHKYKKQKRKKKFHIDKNMNGAN